MLRLFLIALSLALTLAGAFACWAGGKGAWPLLGWGLLLLLATVFERWHYQQHRDDPGPGWVRTEECFEDPGTGKLMRVWYHAETGQRRYLADADHT